MSIKVEVEISSKVIVELPVNSYDDILFDNMTRDESDELIIDAIRDKYNMFPNYIRVIKEIKK